MKIAFLGSSGIGDLLVSTPVLRKLRRLYPKAKIRYIVSSPTPFRELFEDYPYFNELFEVDKGNKFLLVKSILKLWEKEYDIAVCPFPRKFISKIFIRLIRTRKLIESTDDYRSSKNIVQKSIETLENDGIPFNQRDKEFIWPFPLKPFGKKVTKFFRENNIVPTDRVAVIHTGSRRFFGGNSQSPNYWFPDRWMSAVNYLITKYQYKIIFIGQGKENEYTENIISGVKDHSRIINAVDRFSVRETAVLINRSNLFISTNSGPMWIAASLRKKQIAICGPSLSQWNPYNTKAIVVRPPKAPFNEKDFSYMRDISVKMLTDAIDLVLHKSKK